MAEQGFKRKLTTIFSADVVGYSRLMEDNEEATIQTLNTYRDSMSTLIQQHSGRVVDMTGDNLMAEFASVVDAVKCAVEIQKEIGERNADLPENRRMLFRIGANLGDIVEEGDRIYGDGVNIAARLEALAEGGGICISGTAYDQLKNKLELGYEYLGEHSVKNIAAPVRVYKVLMEPEAVGKIIGEKRKTKRWMAVAAAVIILTGLAGWYLYIEQAKQIKPASVEKMAFPLPDKPSIAVLPFDNMSGDPQQEHFSDGITEQIIASLSKVPYLFVIARNSTFTYKAKPVKVSQVAEELGVQYVLEGSVQRSNEQVRITAQLIDAIAGHHIWAENYDRQIKDIFALQDDIAMKIMAALQVKLTVEELGGLSAIKTKNIKAYEKFLKGYEHFWRRTEGDSQQARKLAQVAISLDPEYGAAYILLARTYLDDVWYYRTKSAESLETVEHLVQKSIELSDQDTTAHQILGSVYYLRRQYDKAIEECQKAIALSPNSAEANYFYGTALRWAGRFDEAIPAFKKAIRLNPVTPLNYINNLAWVYAFSEQYEEAISTWNSAIKRNPDYFFAYLGLTLVYQLSGNEVKAREAAAEVMRLKPNLTISKLAKGPATKNVDRKRMLEEMRKAGIPE
jgi:adenylate cyclase